MTHLLAEYKPLLPVYIQTTPLPSYTPRKRFKLPSHIRRWEQTANVILWAWVGFLFVFSIFALLITLSKPQYYPVTIIATPLECQEKAIHVYTVHIGRWKEYELQALSDIVAKYPGVLIYVLDLWNGTSYYPLNRIQAPKTETWKRHQVNHTVRSKPKTPLKFRDHFRTIHSLLGRFPDLIYTRETMANFFSNTPLQRVWKKFNRDLIILAARALTLWESGGISIKLPSGNRTQWLSETRSYGNLSTFLHTPPGIVNVDNDANHMETKTSCQAFFEEIIYNLRVAGSNDTVQAIINATFNRITLVNPRTILYPF